MLYEIISDLRSRKRTRTQTLFWFGSAVGQAAPRSLRSFKNMARSSSISTARLCMRTSIPGMRAQPKYKDRTFFLSGESYAGIYVPTLSKLVVEHINKGQFPNKNFQGAAIGNGFMNVKYLLNSLVLWSAYHGRVSVE
ncbi:hypothetical protein ANCCEY_13300 [Ancylostoma ceylanicum]|uniref:Carboxypeptidase n=1 Tax=Ancylostoma ceylanicum TaxID=53326 RepID=A0A0D6LCN2_9BILA|nr:hypothetical protein ANCCEY_13300 [Ancylostoma ceylanicum]